MKHEALGVVLACTAFMIVDSAEIGGDSAYAAPQVNIERLSAQLQHLATISEVPFPAVTRVLFTEQDLQARRYVKDLMHSTGLTVREDAMGNIFGRWVGSSPNLPAVATGSHTDAIPHAGLYDGCVGVLGAIEAVSALRATGFTPKRSIDVIMFTAEEPTRYGFGCVGSRAMAGVLSTTTLDKAVDSVEKGGSFAKAAAKAGYGDSSNTHEEMISACKLSSKNYSAFVELHIEQGPLLEQKGLSIGVVSAIAAPASLKVEFVGNGGHAGALLMPLRKDAGLAAAELQLAVEEHVLATGAIDTVGTAGLVTLHPGAINSVPRRAHLEIDVRDIDGGRRDAVVQKIIASAHAIAERRGCEVTVAVINQDPPATCGEDVVAAVTASVEQLGLTHQVMVSRAYHDALFMAKFTSTGMIFIPCRNGVSHRPDEFASDRDIAHGVQTLGLTLARLSYGMNHYHEEL